MEIPNRQEIESAFARKMSRLNSRHRRELEAYLGHPPRLSNVPNEFWEKVRRENEEELEAAYLLLFHTSADWHFQLAEGESLTRRAATGGIGGGADLESIMQSASDYARQQAELTSRRIVDTTRDRLTKASIDWTRLELDADEVLRRTKVASDTIKAMGPEGAARVATTETTAAQTAGGEAAIMRTAGLSDDDIWRIHPELSDTGTCPTCRPYDGRPRRIWSIEFPKGPPIHANCNCEIIYANVGVGGGLPPSPSLVGSR